MILHAEETGGNSASEGTRSVFGLDCVMISPVKLRGDSSDAISLAHIGAAFISRLWRSRSSARASRRGPGAASDPAYR